MDASIGTQSIDEVGSFGSNRPLLLTKLYPPRLRRGLLPRPRLMQLLDRSLGHKLTLISTPPGYGKSTLVSQWLERSPHASAWVSLDEADNDPASFFNYLLAAVEAIDRDLTAGTRRLMRTQRGVPVRAIVDSLGTDLAAATRPLFLVLDDFHVIQAPEILAGMGSLITYAPPALHVVLISRTAPRLPLMRMRARGELFELRAADLAFRPEETNGLLCQRYELPLDASQLNFLQTWSEGWPLGLVLLGQALQEREQGQIGAIIDRFSNNPEFIADYLWKELIQSQAADRQRFLLQTSILSQFDPALCDAVTGRSDSDALLDELLEENLFLIPLGERGKWHRYHHLFEDVLRERLARTLPRDEILELHRRAAHWYLTQTLVEQAASHAIKGEDWVLALQILTPLCAELFRQERLNSVLNWLDALPSDVLEREPELSVQLAWASFRTGQPDKGKAHAEVAERGWAAAGNASGNARILVIRALENIFDWDNLRGIERSQRALEQLPGELVEDRARCFLVLGALYTQNGNLAEAEEALMRSRLLAREIGSMPLQLVEMNQSGICLMARGRLEEAVTLFQRTIATGDEWHDIPVAYAHMLLADVYLEQHRLDLAEHMLERALELTDRLNARVHQIRIHRVLAELAWARNDPTMTFREVEQAIASEPTAVSLHEVRSARTLLAELWLREGKLNLARAWASETPMDLDQPPDFHLMEEYLVRVELLGRSGSAGAALTSLESAMAFARAQGHLQNLLYMLVLKASMAKNQGMLLESNAALVEAVELGAADGYVRPFLAFGADLSDQLAELSRSGAHAGYVLHLLDTIRTQQLQGELGGGSSNPLSKRQTEIMRLVASGYSNRDIADQLFISEQTVKKHMVNLFVRLDVSNRTQAVDVARRLNLL